MALAVVSLGAALTAPRDEEGDPDPPTTPAPKSNTPGASIVSFRHPVQGPPQTRQVRRGAHVVLRVTARVAGTVEIPALGLNQSVSPAAPAVFDLLASTPGRYDVMLLPLTGTERIKVGTLVVG